MTKVEANRVAKALDREGYYGIFIYQSYETKEYAVKAVTPGGSNRRYEDYADFLSDAEMGTL